MNQSIEIPEEGLPLTHTFSDGVYAREIFMPKGHIVVGHVHKTRHLNIVSTGKARVYSEGTITEIVAPYTFESGEGARKVLFIEEDMFWTTIHVTDKTDVVELFDELVDKSASDEIDFQSYIEESKKVLIGG